MDYRNARREVEELAGREAELLNAADRLHGSRRMATLLELCEVLTARGLAAKRLARLDRPAVAWMQSR